MRPGSGALLPDVGVQRSHSDTDLTPFRTGRPVTERDEIAVPFPRMFDVQGICLPGKVLHPFSRPRTYWNLLVCVAFSIIAIVYPYRCVSVVDYYHDARRSIEGCRWAFFVKTTPAWFAFDRFMNLFWLIDFLLTLNSGYRFKESIIADRLFIAKHYLLSWMVPDIFVILPYDIFFGTTRHYRRM